MMISEKRGVNSWENRLGLALSLVLFGVVLAFQANQIPDMDNYFISLSTNGLYGESNYCLFISPLLCGLIGALSSLSSEIDWFMFLSRLIIIGSIVWLLVGVWFVERNAIRRTAILSLALFFVVDTGLFSANFTVFSGWFAATGIYMLQLYLFNVEEVSNKVRGVILSGVVILVASSFLFRWECGLLSLPFFFISVLPISINSRGVGVSRIRLDAMRAHRLPLLVLGILAVSISAAQYFVRSLPENASAAQYNSARSSIVDYPIRPYDELDEALPDVSKNDYELARAWFFGDTEFYTADRLNRIAEAGSTRSSDSLVSLTTIKAAYEILSERPEYLFILASVFLGALFSTKDCTNQIKLFLAASLTAAIVIYYAYVGRLPFRVLVVLYMLFSATCLCLSSSASEGRSDLQMSTLTRAMGLTISVLVAVAALVSAQRWVESYRSRMLSPNELTKLSEDQNMVSDGDAEAVFFWDSASFVWAHRRAGVLPTRSYLEHNVPMGTWVYGQPYFEEMLERTGISNPVRYLAENDGVYYVCPEPDNTLQFIEEHYGIEVEARFAGECLGTEVWEIENTDGER